MGGGSDLVPGARDPARSQALGEQISSRPEDGGGIVRPQGSVLLQIERRDVFLLLLLLLPPPAEAQTEAHLPQGREAEVPPRPRAEVAAHSPPLQEAGIAAAVAASASPERASASVPGLRR